MSRDYYKVLGVDEKADQATIKKKYRELAKKYHPDRNHGDKAAEEKFKDISEAYDVVGDAEKRRQYDAMRRFGGQPGMGGFPGGGGGGRFYTEGDFSEIFGKNFSFNDIGGFGGLGDIFSSLFGNNMRTRARTRPGGQRNIRRKGRDQKATIKVSFEQAAAGTTKKMRIAVPEQCNVCGGSGIKQTGREKVCPTCGGSGQISQTQGMFSISRPCPSCLGRGVMQGETCDVCKGGGTVKKRKTISVKIPAGIADGEQIRLRGLGYPGVNGGPKGDLLIKVVVMSDQKFKREGNDIYTKVDVSFPQAALGAKVPVQTLAQKVMVAVKPGTQPGTVMRLRGAGIKAGDKTGDLYVTVTVTVPTSLTDRQKELLQEFEELSKVGV